MDNSERERIWKFRDLALYWARSGERTREQLASIIEIQSWHIEKLLGILGKDEVTNKS